jgi:hypothetical protein
LSLSPFLQFLLLNNGIQECFGLPPFYSLDEKIFTPLLNHCFHDVYPRTQSIDQSLRCSDLFESAESGRHLRRQKALCQQKARADQSAMYSPARRFQLVQFSECRPEQRIPLLFFGLPQFMKSTQAVRRGHLLYVLNQGLQTAYSFREGDAFHGVLDHVASHDVSSSHCAVQVGIQSSLVGADSNEIFGARID